MESVGRAWETQRPREQFGEEAQNRRGSLSQLLMRWSGMPEAGGDLLAKPSQESTNPKKRSATSAAANAEAMTPTRPRIPSPIDRAQWRGFSMSTGIDGKRASRSRSERTNSGRG